MIFPRPFPNSLYTKEKARSRVTQERMVLLSGVLSASYSTHYLACCRLRYLWLYVTSEAESEALWLAPGRRSHLSWPLLPLFHCRERYVSGEFWGTVVYRLIAREGAARYNKLTVEGSVVRGLWGLYCTLFLAFVGSQSLEQVLTLY